MASSLVWVLTLVATMSSGDKMQTHHSYKDRASCIAAGDLVSQMLESSTMKAKASCEQMEAATAAALDMTPLPPVTPFTKDAPFTPGDKLAMATVAEKIQEQRAELVTQAIGDVVRGSIFAGTPFDSHFGIDDSWRGTFDSSSGDAPKAAPDGGIASITNPFAPVQPRAAVLPEGFEPMPGVTFGEPVEIDLYGDGKPRNFNAGRSPRDESGQVAHEGRSRPFRVFRGDMDQSHQVTDSAEGQRFGHARSQ
jgi:hypothetical protein